VSAPAPALTLARPCCVVRSRTESPTSLTRAFYTPLSPSPYLSLCRLSVCLSPSLRTNPHQRRTNRYHIADLYDTLGNAVEAIKWFNILITLVPSDPGILARLGAIYDKQDDRSQAYHYHNESYRHYPANINVISWLGVWHVKEDRYEKAVEFFKRAAQIMPQEVRVALASLCARSRLRGDRTLADPPSICLIAAACRCPRLITGKVAAHGRVVLPQKW